MRIRFIVCFAAIALPSVTQALTLEELKRYDKDGNGKLDSEELRIYQLHKDDPILAKYDTNNDGVLDAKELRRLRADIDKRYGAIRPSSQKPVLTPEEIFARGKGAYEAANGGIALEDLVEKPKKVPDECAPDQSVYVRQDRLDTYLYGITPVAKAKGASISYTNDREAQQRTAKIDGFIAVVPFRDPCLRRPPGADLYLSAYAIAPWVSAHGSFNEPITKSEKSDLKVGIDGQVTFFGGGIFNYQAFTASPHTQTDFRGEARAGGFSGSWEPYQYFVRLGGSPHLFSEYLDWYWQFQGEADVKRVTAVGVTDLQLGSYAWFGSTIRLHAFLFPTTELVPEILRNRLHLTTTFQGYWDADSKGKLSTPSKIGKYSWEVAYNLTDDGAASVSLEYERGRSKDTLERINQYVVKLNYKY